MNNPCIAVVETINPKKGKDCWCNNQKNRKKTDITDKFMPGNTISEAHGKTVKNCNLSQNDIKNDADKYFSAGHFS